MGPPLTTLLGFWQSAVSTALRKIFTTTLPPSLGDQCGAFDAPNAKCPPDILGGSLNWVTAGSAPSSLSLYPTPPDHSPSEYFNKPRSALPQTPPLTPDYSPRSPTTSLPNSQSSPISIVKPIVTGLETPPATPESSPRGLVGQSSQTLDFLTSLFPSAALRALPYAKSVQVSSADMGASWEGVILSLPGQPKTLYVGGKGAEKVKLRESIVAILDLAEEHLECESFVIALDKSSPALGDLLHSFMYLGGTIVSEPPFPCDPACILVGIEL